MSIKHTIKVLIVDDSALFRHMIKQGIEQDAMIEVIGFAANADEAREMLNVLKPDVLTLDIEMPGLSGLDFLREMMPEMPVRAIVVSSLSDAVFDAMQAGALDFVGKPDGGAEGIKRFCAELIIKIKIASMSKVSRSMVKSAPTQSILGDAANSRIDLIAIGASTGGTEAISLILKELSKDSPGILIVQHMPAQFTKLFANRLNQISAMTVREAQDGESIRQGTALVAPGGLQMEIQKRGRETVVCCFEGKKVNGHAPSVDVLFKSAAECFGASAVGVLLTGMGSDGAKGLLQMKKSGAFTIAQDEASSIVYGMPKVALEIGAVSLQSPLSEMAAALIKKTHINIEP